MDVDGFDLTPLLRRRVKTLVQNLYNALTPPSPSPLESSTDDPSTGTVPFDSGKHLCSDHQPTNKRRRLDPKYWYYNSVRSSCKECVAFCIQKHGLPKDVPSDTNGYTARDFAVYDQLPDMVTFLDKL